MPQNESDREDEAELGDMAGFVPCVCEYHTQDGKPSMRVTSKTVASEADLKGCKNLSHCVVVSMRVALQALAFEF